MLDNLFVFELANNHQGDVNHGLKIIDAMGAIKTKYGIRAAVKFQFRDFSTFIHKDAMSQVETNDKIKRFVSTKLDWEDFKKLIDRVKSYNMITMCTPFDESSVDYINSMDIDIIKVGSPSLFDDPLLLKIKNETNKPIIISSGGCDISRVDKLVSMFKDRYLGLMHCVSIYPTPIEKMNLNTITNFKNRYPNITIGFSTHEDPSNTDFIKVAYALGARMFEKHVGVDILNKYSASPEQTDEWVKSFVDVVKMIGDDRYIDETENGDLEKLYRGVFFKKDMKKGDTVTTNDVYYAFPKNQNGIHSGEFSNFQVDYDAVADSPVLKTDVESKDDSIIESYVRDVRSFYPKLPDNITVSHHNGQGNIYNTGCVMYNVVDEELYSKKVIIQIAGQKHPEHYHKIKTETFVIVEGTMDLYVDGVLHTMNKNDTFTIKPFVKHSFSTSTGVVFEEIATSITNLSDSFYTEKHIQEKSDKNRKTFFTLY